MGTVGVGGGGMWQREYRSGMAQSYTSSEAWFLVSPQCAFSRCAQKMGLAQKSTSLIGLTPLPSPTLVLFVFVFKSYFPQNKQYHSKTRSKP